MLEPDYRAPLKRFMHNVWEDDAVVCERCVNGEWFPWDDADQAVMNELFQEMKELEDD